jgi:hypothetical protein
MKHPAYAALAWLSMMAIGSDAWAQAQTTMQGLEPGYYVIEIPGNVQVAPGAGIPLEGLKAFKIDPGIYAAQAPGSLGDGGYQLPWPWPEADPAASNQPTTSFSDSEIQEVVALCKGTANPANYGVCKRLKVAAP